MRRVDGQLFHAEAAGHLAADDGLRFGWVGRRLRPFARQLDWDVTGIALGARFAFVGDVADAAPYLAAADGLLVTSRYDPQPLVPIEAALVATPTVGFATAGAGDLAADGAALAVPYPDCARLAHAVRRVLADPSLSAALVAAAVRRWEGSQAEDRVIPAFVAEVRALTGQDGRLRTDREDRP